MNVYAVSVTQPPAPFTTTQEPSIQTQNWQSRNQSAAPGAFRRPAPAKQATQQSSPPQRTRSPNLPQAEASVTQRTTTPQEKHTSKRSPQTFAPSSLETRVSHSHP